MTKKYSGNARKKPGTAAIPAAPRDIDRTDREILRLLQQDGRMSVSDLAARVHLSVSPCLARVRRLEAAGYIAGYFARLNPELLGLGLLAYISIQLDRTTPDVFEKFSESMQGFNEVLECHMVGGGFDYLIKVRVADMGAYRRFLGERLARVRGIQQTHTYFVMEEIKSTHAFAFSPT